jgi:hypothetical protein
MKKTHLTVGADACDIRGFTNTHIQCAVDRVANLGGGTVELSTGVFSLADSVHLRSGVTVCGAGPGTVLRKNAVKSARITVFLGYGHDDIVVDTPDLFALGDGVLLRDDNAMGFYTTVGTLVARDGDTWFTSRPHCHDYLSRNHGVVETVFPGVSACDVTDVALANLAIDGNLAENPIPLNGCRGGGFFALRSKNVRVRGVQVREFNGEGFSFQTCDDLELADCEARECTGNGFHPGSGSNRFHIHGCRALNNGQCGLFYCLRVRDSLLEECELRGNGSHGISIGARDTGHRNRRLVIRDNGGCGVYFRPDPPADAPHGNTIENCILEHNAATGGDDAAEILLQGGPENVQVVGNTLRPRSGVPALLVRPGMPPFVNRDNHEGLLQNLCKSQVSGVGFQCSGTPSSPKPET